MPFKSRFFENIMENKAFIRFPKIFFKTIQIVLCSFPRILKLHFNTENNEIVLKTFVPFPIFFKTIEIALLQFSWIFSFTVSYRKR